MEPSWHRSIFLGQIWPVRSFRRANGASSATRRRIDTSGVDPATIGKPPVREAAKTPCHSTPERPSSESDTTLYRITRRPLARVGGLFVARLDRHRSLKTQQRTENDEAPRPRFGVGEGLHRPPVLPGETVFPSMPFGSEVRSLDRAERTCG